MIMERHWRRDGSAIPPRSGDIRVISGVFILVERIKLFRWTTGPHAYLPFYAMIHTVGTFWIWSLR